MNSDIHVYINTRKYLLTLLLADGTLRLNGRTAGNEGILEIYHSNSWGSICNDFWNEVASDVACKQMGFRRYISFSTSNTIQILSGLITSDVMEMKYL